MKLCATLGFFFKMLPFSFPNTARLCCRCNGRAAAQSAPVVDAECLPFPHQTIRRSAACHHLRPPCHKPLLVSCRWMQRNPGHHQSSVAGWHCLAGDEQSPPPFSFSSHSLSLSLPELSTGTRRWPIDGWNRRVGVLWVAGYGWGEGRWR